jgi:hypothetical protein
MESGNTIGTWIAYGAISLFLLLLFALFVRTALMVGSVFILAWTRRRERTSGSDDGESAGDA